MQPYTNHLWKLIELYPDKPWDWRGISSNPNITWEIIQASLDASRGILDKYWNWECMSFNKFEKDKIIVTRNQKKAKRWIKNHINEECSCPTVIAKLISDFVY